MPRWNTISISGYHIREAGSTAVQEVAFTLSNAIAYVEAALGRGLAIDDVAPRLSFFFNAHANFFEEVAKFRAARSLWAEIARDRFGAKDPRSWRLRFHTQTAGSTLTAQQPEVNVVRVALQAFSAVLGGTQSLHTNASDEALALPTEESARLALRTQQVIANETGVADVVDPLGGSHLVEAWTAEIRERARALIRKVDELGGAVAAIEQGFLQKEIEAAFRYTSEVESGEQVIVGVDRFATGRQQRLPTGWIRGEAVGCRPVSARSCRADAPAADATLAEVRLVTGAPATCCRRSGCAACQVHGQRICNTHREDSARSTRSADAVASGGTTRPEEFRQAVRRALSGRRPLLDVPFAVLDLEQVTRRRAHRLVSTIGRRARAAVRGRGRARLVRKGVRAHGAAPGNRRTGAAPRCSPTALRPVAAPPPRCGAGRGGRPPAAVAALVVLSTDPRRRVAAAATTSRIVPDHPAAPVAAPTAAAAQPKARPQPHPRARHSPRADRRRDHGCASVRAASAEAASPAPVA